MGKKITRIIKRGNGDFHQCYRPCRISEVYGQYENTKVIAKCLDEDSLARSVMLYGVSGSGKTTLGRIIAMGLNCKGGPTSEPCCECNSCRQVMNGNSMSFLEINAADFTGIDKVRQLRGEFSATPFGDDRKRIYLFDECHGLSKEAQNALLKSLEDAREHNQFILCSTEPEKIIEPLRNRCMDFEFKEVQRNDILELLIDVVLNEGYQVNPKVLEVILEQAKGRPRNALSELQKAIAAGKFKKAPTSVEESIRNIQNIFGQISGNIESEEVHMTKD